MIHQKCQYYIVASQMATTELADYHVKDIEQLEEN